MSVNKIVLNSLVPRGDWEVRTLPVWRALLENNEEVAWLAPLLLVTFSRISDSGMSIHASFYFNLFVAHCLRMGFPVQSNCLFLVTDSLDAPIVELFKSRWYYHLNGRHWGQFWLVHSSKRGAEKRTFHLCSIFVTNVVKSVVFQKVVVENCVTILLVNISTMEKTI